jgi:D-alanine--poly(phosphoribitol) ligase subunit 1
MLAVTSPARKPRRNQFAPLPAPRGDPTAPTHSEAIPGVLVARRDARYRPATTSLPFRFLDSGLATRLDSTVGKVSAGGRCAAIGGDVVCSDAIGAFFARAGERPAHPAVVEDGRTVSYAALARRARCLAQAFARFPEPRVLIALPSGAEAYAAMLAAALAGGYYSPVNVDSPLLKLCRIARQLQPDIIVSDGGLAAGLLAETPGAMLVRPPDAPDTPLPDDTRRRHRIAYVIFTSGSTGTPKGVVIPRTALDHYVGWMRGSHMFGAEDRVSQYANIGFDFSVMEIYGALCAGATLFPVQGRGDRLFPARMITREKITVWSSVPSVISLMMRADSVTADNLASLRWLNFCGEPLLPQHLRAIFAACPHVVVQNTYGPTEATVSMTSLVMTAGDYEAACRSSVALGEPIAEMGLHLVGGRHDDEGELVITGPQVADGYWQDPQRSAERFREVALAGRTVTGYFTGDWAERHARHIFFKERMDFQVKVKGVRVELDEVAAALREIGWPVVCVLSRGDHLVAVVERHGAARFDQYEVIEALAARLDDAAVPRIVRLIDQMPYNENDKIDRAAVAAWFDAAERRGNRA